jgi:hypothetical protein
VPETEDFFAQFHFNRKTVGVFQDFEGQAQIFGNGAIVLQVKRLSFAWEIIEDTFVLCLLDPVFYKPVQIFHTSILNGFAELAIAVTFMEFSMPIFGISNLQFPIEVLYWKLEMIMGTDLSLSPMRFDWPLQYIATLCEERNIGVDEKSGQAAQNVNAGSN